MSGLAHVLPPTPADLAGAWGLDPAVLVGLTVGVVAYGRGARHRARSGRGLVSKGQAACFGAAAATLAVALLSPLAALGEALFAAHMVQHLLLVLVAAPLLVLARPVAPVLWGLPPWLRRGAALAWPRALRRPLRHPGAVWVLHVGALWIWHLPPLYQAALQSEMLHALEHASFLGTALLYWAVLLRLARPDATRQGVGIVYVFLAMTQSGALGALMALATAPWYTLQTGPAAAWGLTALEDQQLAGLIMWVPASFVYLGVGVALMARWLAAAEAAVERREARGRVRPRA